MWNEKQHRKRFCHLFQAVLTLTIFLLAPLPASASVLRLLVIGNSFSVNATRYLPDLAKSGGHELIIVIAQTGGCSLERHWNALAADLANPEDVRGKIYGEKSLRQIMRVDEFDIITIQQASLLSGDIGTYRPFAQKLCDELKKMRPKAEIVIHQTWAYRSDADSFGLIDAHKSATSEHEMWEQSRAAYRLISTELTARVIPTGDAFWKVDSDPLWGYKPDKMFDFKIARPPVLPDQNTSLHAGYYWSPGARLTKDTHHANTAGEYLAALVWYGFLFNESPERLTFVPPGIAPEFAAQLRKVAWAVMHESQ